MPTEQELMAAALKRNLPYVKGVPQSYNTDLTVAEPGFRAWVQQNKVPFDPNEPGPSDYDMRGFYHALMTGNPIAQSSVNPNDQRIHYPDYWKTPYHETFSEESQWAGQTAPKWNAQDQLISPSGRILRDERNPGLGSILSVLNGTN